MYGIPNWNFLHDVEKVNFVYPESEIPVRVISVPKTLKTPRIIGVEPVAMQYCQQGVLEILVPLLETSPYLSGSVNFTDQTKNQVLALKSSSSGRFSTIDLSEASDRVSNQLVIRMLKTTPNFLEVVQACRSYRADVPGFGLLNLAKFASMGSALCFPIEAMVFCTIILVGIQRQKSHLLSLREIRSILKDVRIYGDDIIIPVEYASAVMRELEAFGLRVNQHKSFWTGKFRESCGVEAYDGIDVTPVRLRRMPPTSLQNGPEVVSYTSFSNQCYWKGMWKTAHYVRNHMSKLTKLPYVTRTSGLLGWNTYDNSYRYSRLSPDTHSPVVLGLVLKGKPRKSPLDGSSALMKFFLKRGCKPLQGDHLHHSGRPVSATLRYRWGAPF
jgi:hypothetical protein